MEKPWKDKSIQWNDLLETTGLNSDELEELFSETNNTDKET